MASINYVFMIVMEFFVSFNFDILLYFFQCTEHGFPNKSTAMAFDPKLELLAIGTKQGTIKMYPFLIYTLYHKLLLYTLSMKPE